MRKRMKVGLLLLVPAALLNGVLNGMIPGIWMPQDPPRTIEPLPLPGTPAKKPSKPTMPVFGDDFDSVHVKRPKRIGAVTEFRDLDTDELVMKIKATGVRIKQHVCPDESCEHPTDLDYARWMNIWLEGGQEALDAEYASWPEEDQ